MHLEDPPRASTGRVVFAICVRRYTNNNLVCEGLEIVYNQLPDDPNEQRDTREQLQNLHPHPATAAEPLLPPLCSLLRLLGIEEY